jgi:lauroyl/myristoyl acyltransferase
MNQMYESDEMVFKNSKVNLCMAYLFLADQAHLRKKKTADTPDSKTNLRNKKDDQSWGDSMGSLFKIIKFIDESRFYRFTKLMSFSSFNGLGHLFGQLFFGRSRKVQRRMQASIRALYPEKSEKWVAKISKANGKYMGMLLLDMLFRLPRTCDFKAGEQVTLHKYERYDLLDRELAKGKGVIVPILHIGQQFHSPQLFLHPKRYKMSVAASIKNLPMWEFNNRAHFNNLNIYASTSYSKIAPLLQRDLNNNYCLVVYHDYSSVKQLRVPVIHRKYPYLIHTPQSYISLHKKTGAPILPLIAFPNGVFGKSTLRFLDNSSIAQVSEKYWDASKREFHGRLATEINRRLYPYIRVFAHQWEELMRFAGLRAADKLKFPPNITVKDFLQQIHAKMDLIIENSYEPDRPDEKINDLIHTLFDKLMTKITTPDAIFRAHKSFIDLSLMNALSELEKIAKIAITELRKAGELDATLSFEAFLTQIVALQTE